MDDQQLSLTVKAKDEASSTIKGVNKNIRETGNSVQDTSKNLKIAGAAIAAVGAGLTVYEKKATDFTVSYVKGIQAISRVTGETVEQTSRLQYAFQRSGVDAQAAGQVFGIFSKKIVEASDNTKYAGTALGQLGIKVLDATGKTRGFSDILFDVADKFKSLPNGAEKTALSMEIFGRSGKNLIPILNKGSEGIRQLEADADKLGLTLSAKNVDAVAKYVQSQKDLKASSDALKLSVGTLTAPVMASFNNKINEAATAFLKWQSPLKDAAVNVIAFGGPILTASGGIIAFAANLRTAVSGMKLASLAATALRVAMGPIGLLVTGITAVVAGLTYLFTRHKDKTEEVTKATGQQITVEQQLNETMEQQARNIDQATQSTNALTDAKFSAEGSSLGVERAQRSYNEAVKEYGPASLEAREASYSLERAKKDLEEANKKVALAEDAVRLSEGQLIANTPSVVAEIQTRVDKFSNLASMIGNANLAVQNLDSAASIVAPKIQGTISNLQAGASKLQSSITVGIQGAQGTQLQGSSPNLQRRAVGGPVRAGVPYLIGENRRPEVFVPNESGQVLTEDQARGGTTVTNNFLGNITINTREAADRFFERLNEKAQLSSMGVPT